MRGDKLNYLDNTKNNKKSTFINKEPYKAAVSQFKSSKSDISNDLASQTNENNLIRYKTDTDLIKFNENLLNIHNEFDLNKDLESSNYLDVNFKDARFYTDYHFLKLANQLKDRLQATATTSNSFSTASSNRQINIVEPLSFNQQLIENNDANLERNEVTSPVSSSIWRIQRQQYEDRIKYLEEQIKGFYEQLELQTSVNCELKKLLVASIGDDIQYKVERLINDKQRFEYELTLNNKRLNTMSEELEQISIQCDLWRTKCIATKSISDELNLWKQFLLFLQHEYNLLIRNLLTEKDNNSKKLGQTLNSLIIYKNHVNNSNSNDNMNDITSFNSNQIIDLINKNINEVLKNSEHEILSLDSNININIEQTKHEFMAKQMLIQFSWLPLSNLNTIDSIEIMLNALKIQKLQVMERFTDANFVCCSKCKGNIKVI